MSIIHRIRLYHAVLVVLVVISYLSGEWGLIHSWLGYGVAAVIAMRLIAALSGVPQLGLSRFYPDFAGLDFTRAFSHPAISKTLLFGIAVTLIGATVTGIALDKGDALGIAGLGLATALADDDEDDDNDGKDGNEFMEEAHEILSDLLILIAVLHIAYVWSFKRPLARFMAFLDPGKRAKP